MWNHENNKAGFRSEELKVTLYGDGQIIKINGVDAIVTLNENNRWHASWSNLPKYNDRHEEIKYIGSQLSPHWIYRNFKIQGDAIVAFTGECKVDLTEMVDIEDVINNEPIYSKNMLSFISEQFGISLREGVFRQRLLMCVIKELLEERWIFVVRNGDDLLIDNKKLSVSIATKSITSILIHTGLNIVSEGAPVPASGLASELGIKDIKEFALEVMKRYSEELEDIEFAAAKVRGVAEQGWLWELTDTKSIWKKRQESLIHLWKYLLFHFLECFYFLLL